MSFDLFFCWQEPKRIDFEAVAKWAEKIEYFERQNNQLWYQNPDTGVYFSIGYDAAPPDDSEDSRVPAGCNDTGLSFNLNYNRAGFFGYEAMPVVARLVQDFSLGIYDPQAGEDAQGARYGVDAKPLLNSWLDHNRRAALALLQEKAAHAEHMPRAKSLRMWKYMSDKKHMEQRVAAEDTFVPKIVPVQHKNARKLELAFVCSEGAYCLVPVVDWVFIVRRKKRLFKSKAETEVGIISYATFLELMGHLLQPFDDDSVKQIRRESAEEMTGIIRKFRLPDNRGHFKLAGMDSFIDSEIAETTGG
jgi:hypothetical protein